SSTRAAALTISGRRVATLRATTGDGVIGIAGAAAVRVAFGAVIAGIVACARIGGGCGGCGRGGTAWPAVEESAAAAAPLMTQAKAIPCRRLPPTIAISSTGSKHERSKIACSEHGSSEITDSEISNSETGDSGTTDSETADSETVNSETAGSAIVD